MSRNGYGRCRCIKHISYTSVAILAQGFLSQAALSQDVFGKGKIHHRGEALRIGTMVTDQWRNAAGASACCLGDGAQISCGGLVESHDGKCTTITEQ